MDGKGCWRDNVFGERLWRSVKYEGVYLKAFNGVSAARQSCRGLGFLQRAPAAPDTRRVQAGHGLLRRAAADARCSLMG
jgi:hypothetical protein